MKKPSEAERDVIFLLFPELADRVHIDWRRLEFSAESQEQIANVVDALAEAHHKGYQAAAERSRTFCARSGGCI